MLKLPITHATESQVCFWVAVRNVELETADMTQINCLCCIDSWLTQQKQSNFEQICTGSKNGRMPVK